MAESSYFGRKDPRRWPCRWTLGMGFESAAKPDSVPKRPSTAAEVIHPPPARAGFSPWKIQSSTHARPALGQRPGIASRHWQTAQLQGQLSGS